MSDYFKYTLAPMIIYLSVWAVAIALAVIHFKNPH